ncbi:DUF3899 domain-containing protein [Metabacillus mangrovi]|nr:DUF3899 domain-containing protein [Metabacillus mangrovi]
MKKGVYIFAGGVIAAVVISFIFYREITLLSFINILFLISGMMIFASLFALVAQGGFFDGISYSFRKTFAVKEMSREELEEMRPFSELVSFRYTPLLVGGGTLAALMLVCLGIFYM